MIGRDPKLERHIVMRECGGHSSGRATDRGRAWAKDTAMNPAVLDSFALAIAGAHEPPPTPASPATNRMLRKHATTPPPWPPPWHRSQPSPAGERWSRISRPPVCLPRSGRFCRVLFTDPFTGTAWHGSGTVDQQVKRRARRGRGSPTPSALMQATEREHAHHLGRVHSPADRGTTIQNVD